MKALITGYPGTGKSSVAEELRRRGYAAYDAEAVPGLMHAEDIVTGARIPLPSPVPRGWFETTGGYNWDVPRMTDLLNTHTDIFISALADNQELFYDSFDTIFLLLVDEAEMERRLLSRTTTDYGKDPGELADIMLNHERFEQNLLALGAVAINARPALPEVVDEILTYAYEPSPR